MSSKVQLKREKKINWYTPICTRASKSNYQPLIVIPHVWHHLSSFKSAMVGAFTPR